MPIIPSILLSPTSQPIVTDLPSRCQWGSAGRYWSVVVLTGSTSATSRSAEPLRLKPTAFVGRCGFSALGWPSRTQQPLRASGPGCRWKNIFDKIVGQGLTRLVGGLRCSQSAIEPATPITNTTQEKEMMATAGRYGILKRFRAHHSKARAEFARVFGENKTTDSTIRTFAYIHFAASGWPESYDYDCRLAAEVLGNFPTGHGTTEAGDAEVCAELEAAGAVLCLRSRRKRLALLQDGMR